MGAFQSGFDVDSTWLYNYSTGTIERARLQNTIQTPGSRWGVFFPTNHTVDTTESIPHPHQVLLNELR